MLFEFPSSSLREVSRACFVRISTDDDKFLTPDPADDVAFSRRHLENGPDFPDHLVADVVSVSVVDLLEVIHVDEDASQQLVFSGRCGPFLSQALHGAAAVGQTREVVRQGGLLQLAIGERQLRRIAPELLLVAAQLILQKNGPMGRADAREPLSASSVPFYFFCVVLGGPPLRAWLKPRRIGLARAWASSARSAACCR